MKRYKKVFLLIKGMLRNRGWNLPYDRVRRDRSRSPRRSGGTVVYVVVVINRYQRCSVGTVDNQDDIEISGVFTTHRAAQQFIDGRNQGFSDFNRYVIHESVLNPGSSTIQHDTFHPEIYS